MTEDFLYYIWKYKLAGRNFITTSGEALTVVDPGFHNSDSGPDFFNARIKMKETIWAGNIEIHIKASDWYKHKHHRDDAYNNVILHVVYEEDRTVRRNGSHESIPAVELAGTFDQKLYDTYRKLVGSKLWVPCQSMISSTNRTAVNNMLDRTGIERLQKKSQGILDKLSYNGNGWEETFYQVLARNFGFKVNGLPFELLARSLPLKILMRHQDRLFQLEALLFGQAGMLAAKCQSKYFKDLRKEYTFLVSKYGLQPIDKSLWKFAKLRPSNFPTIRIAQFAQLVFHASFLFSKVLETRSLADYLQLFTCRASSFWDNHYTFGVRSGKRTKHLGKGAKYLLLINAVVPVLFLYGQKGGNQGLVDRSMKLLETIPGETNSDMLKWKALGMSVLTSFNTQALLELKSSYCNRKACLQCMIGYDLLKNTRCSADQPE